MRLRKITPDKFDTIYKILTDTSEWLSMKKIDLWGNAYPEHLFRKDSEDGFVYVAEYEGITVGTVTLRDKPPAYYPSDIWHEDDRRSLYLFRLAVSPEFHGKGFGVKILEQVEEMAREQKVKRIRLDCDKNLSFLKQYYLSAGYKLIREAAVKDYQCILMERDVAYP